MLAEDDPSRGLGPALAWALRNGATSLDLLAERDTGALARRAAGLRFPIEVWHVDDRTLLPAVAEPLPAPPAAVARPTSRSSTRSSPAARCRTSSTASSRARSAASRSAASSTTSHTGAVRLEVGVGAHDREAFTIMHGDVPTVDALAGVVTAVAAHRAPGRTDHPLNRLVPERLAALAARTGPGCPRASPPCARSSRRCHDRT